MEILSKETASEEFGYRRTSPKTQSRLDAFNIISLMDITAAATVLDIKNVKLGSMKMFPFSCDLCYRKFTNLNILKNHIRENHDKGSILQHVADLDADISLAFKESLIFGNKDDIEIESEEKDPEWVPEDDNDETQ